MATQFRAIRLMSLLSSRQPQEGAGPLPAAPNSPCRQIVRGPPMHLPSSSRRFPEPATLAVLSPVLGLLLAAGSALALPIATLDAVQVTATREPTPVTRLPALMTVISGEELRARGAGDLRTAVAFAAGVEFSPGGDGGPAAAVGAFWGLREQDAYLLVVDGVPWGGAFNPATASLSLEDVERIEILRGAAPVLFGATSFVGVIQVIHYPVGQSSSRASVSGGSRGEVRGSIARALPALGGYRHSLSVDGERARYADPRAAVDGGHLLYRGAAALAGGELRLDADLRLQRQSPDSPVVREGPVLTDQTPRDANHNPADGRVNEDRQQLSLGYRRPTPLGSWDTTLSGSLSTIREVRGFLREDLVDDGSPNADGFRQQRRVLDGYADSHLAVALTPTLGLTVGADLLLGLGRQTSANFEYVAALAPAAPPPGSRDVPIDETISSRDRRRFAGLYLQGSWQPVDTLDLHAGLRLNQTDEQRRSQLDSAADPASSAAASDSRDNLRLTGTVGASQRLYAAGRDELIAYADYRHSYKPAAWDFGYEYQPDILEPETANSYEAGLKGRALDTRLQWQASLFRVDFRNLVLITAGLAENAGAERFQGGELELRFAPFRDGPMLPYTVLASYSYHDARFRDYRQDFGGTPTQLSGRQLELAPTHLAAFGVQFLPAQGWQLSLVAHYVGARYLNRRNTAEAGDYFTADASLGYRLQRYTVAVHGYNLGDSRAPVSESELGEGAYYRLPARSLLLSLAADLD